jgi:hypothetical protein
MVVRYYHWSIFLGHLPVCRSRHVHFSGWVLMRLQVNRYGRVQSNCDGTRWRTGGEVKGKTGAWNGYPVLFTLPRNLVYLALLPLIRTPADLNGLVLFAERRNLVSACVPSHFKLSLPLEYFPWTRSSVSIQTCIFQWLGLNASAGRLRVKCTTFRGSVKSTGYPLHSPVSPFTSPPVRHRVPLPSCFNWTINRNGTVSIGPVR